MTTEKNSAPLEPHPAVSATRRRRYSRRFLGNLIFATVFVSMVLASFVMFLLNAHEATNRSICQSHLKQIILGLQNYESVHGAFPPACTVDAEGNPLHSWRTLILPYLDQKELYASIDLSKPWDDPANAHASTIQIPTYICPSLDLPPGFTTYQAIVGADACLHPTEPRTIKEIIDGTCKSVMLVEVSQQDAVHWMSPIDHGRQFLLDINREKHPQPHGRVNMVYACGEISSVASTMKPEMFPPLININDGAPFCDEF